MVRNKVETNLLGVKVRAVRMDIDLACTREALDYFWCGERHGTIRNVYTESNGGGPTTIVYTVELEDSGKLVELEARWFRIKPNAEQ